MTNTPPPPPPPGNQPPPPPAGGAPPPPPGAPAPPTYGGAPYGAGGQNYSSWGSRVGAYLVRGLCVLPPAIAAAIVVGIGFAIADVIGILLAIVVYIGIIAMAIRLMIQRAHLGYDVGDAVVGQTLLSESTRAPMGSGWMVFGRQLLHFLDQVVCYIGFLWPLWDSKRQTFADKIISTVVVDDIQHRHSAGDLWKNAMFIWEPVTKD